MANRFRKERISLLAPLAVLTFLSLDCQQAQATRLPDPLKEVLKTTFPQSNIRLDGVVQTKDGALFLPLIPKDKVKSPKVVLAGQLPVRNPTLYLFDNGWAFLKAVDISGKKVLSLPDGLPVAEVNRLKTSHLPGDLIVPDKLLVVEVLKPCIGDLQIGVLTPAGTAKPATTAASATSTASPQSAPAAQAQPSGPVSGLIAVTSPATGKISLMGDQMEKIAELPTDGTPGGMACANGKIFVADQSKHRILIIDPIRKEFIGQIDLPAGSSPKGLAAHPNGKLLYVAECTTNNIGVVELATEKVLVHTRVAPGPTKIAITPNTYTLLAINSPSGQVSFLSTLNQKLMGVIKVGNMPTDIAITKNSRAAFISNRGSNTVSVIDVAQRRVINTLATGEGPTGIVLSADDRMLFVANAKANSISVIDLIHMKKVQDVSLPIDVEFPPDMMLLPDGKHLLVTSAATEMLGIMNIETLQFEKQPALGYSSVDLLWVPL
jgi:40-residue YVTN family beta-propeller repeat